MAEQAGAKDTGFIDVTERPKRWNFDDVLDSLRRLRGKHFYGTIQLGMRDGEFTQIEIKPVFKPGDPLP